MVLATLMMVSTSIEMKRSLASTSLCSGASKVSSLSSGGGTMPGYWFSLSKQPLFLLLSCRGKRPWMPPAVVPG